VEVGRTITRSDYASSTDKLGVSEPEIRFDTGTEAFGRETSLSWSSDRSFLIAAILLGAVGLGTYGLAASSRFRV
jgi:hypothetical protein